ncbi:transcriptional regulator [Lysobacter xinjiangensis]|uniref:Transcriptional regulator n=1 Tax=Cognatilysobacter xinjiangensis TaxID=546892 RepID=A0ABQ3BTP0_9GAMM|nr:helix-turn-helix transcriptional regulator [Lysobacter xinjiangensis]GGZ57153.1 transcriptional regulator [Lysobacter xinjiangensis]
MPVEVRDLPVFARRLRFLRERAGLTQRELGRRIGMQENAASPRINQYESGTHVPRLETAQALAKELKVPVAYLFADGERLARMILAYSQLSAAEQEAILREIERGNRVG